MGSGIFLGLDIGKSGVMASQKALNVVGHNISNSETKGYSRQEVSLKTNNALNDHAAGQVGTGVTLKEIRRIRDTYIDEQLRDQTSFQHRVQSLSDSLDELQTIMNEPSDSNISAAIDHFFQALEDVNNQPENSSVRITMVEKANSLTSQVNVVYKRMMENLANTNEKIVMKVDKVNSIANSIVDMNKEIAKGKNSGQNPNDVMDARDVLLDELSELVNVSVREDDLGVLYVRVGEHLLVQGNKVKHLNVVSDPYRPGMSVVSSHDFYPESSSDPSVVEAYAGGDADPQDFALTVFDVATNHKMQSEALLDIKSGLTEKSTLGSAGITSGSIILNGVQIWFEEGSTFSELADTINHSGIGVQAYFEREKLILKSTQTGTAHQVSLTKGTSNLTDVMGFSDEQEVNTFGEVVFDGRVKDARYALNNVTYTSSINKIDNVVPGVDVLLKKVGSASISVDPLITSGQIKGLMEYQDAFIEEEIRNLDQFAYAFTKHFNRIHYEGFGLDGKSQRLFFENFDSPFEGELYKGAASSFAVDLQMKGNVDLFAAAKGVFDKDEHEVPVSSGAGDGNNALELSALKFARIVENDEYNTQTRLSVLNGGNGVDVGREEARFTISDGEKTAVVSLEHFDNNSTIHDLEAQINDALNKNAFDTTVTLTTLADGRMRLISSNKSLTFLEGPGTTASDLHLTASSGGTGNGTMIIESSGLNAKYRGEPKTLNGYVSSTVAEVGVKAEEMNRLVDNTKVITMQLENERQSVSGVSIDEELTKMIQFQQAFNASARIISMVDEMLTTIVALGR
jgi:flagellar hook-associated protein FlgK